MVLGFSGLPRIPVMVDRDMSPLFLKETKSQWDGARNSNGCGCDGLRSGPKSENICGSCHFVALQLRGWPKGMETFPAAYSWLSGDLYQAISLSSWFPSLSLSFPGGQREWFAKNILFWTAWQNKNPNCLTWLFKSRPSSLSGRQSLRQGFVCRW